MFVITFYSIGYKPFPPFNHKHKKSVKLFCSSGGSGKTLMQTRKPTDITVSVSTFLCINLRNLPDFHLLRKAKTLYVNML